MFVLRRDRASRFVAALLVALLATPVGLVAGQIPPEQCTPELEQQGLCQQRVNANLPNDLFIRQGETNVTQGASSKPTFFIDGNGSLMAATVRVYNTGGAVNNVPIFVWADGDADGNGRDYRAFGCTNVNVPQGSVTTPTVVTRKVTLVRNPNAPEATADNNSFLFKVLVNRQPPSIVRTAGGNNFCSPSSAADSTIVDTNSTNNVAFFRVVKDLRPDLEIKELRWCRGNATDDTRDECAQDFGAWPLNYNATRGPWCDALPAAQCPANTDHSANGTYLEAEIVNENGTWTDLRNWGGACRFTYATPGTTTWEDVGLLVPSCPNLRYDVKFSIAPATGTPENFNAPGTLQLTNVSVAPAGIGKVHSRTWFIQNYTGRFVGYAEIDAAGNLTEVDITNNEAYNRDIEVTWTDFWPQIVLSDLRTTPTNPYPYPVSGTVEIRGRVQYHNEGPGVPLRFTPAGTSGDPSDVDIARVALPVTVWLDNKTSLDATWATPLNKTQLETTPYVASFTFTNHTDADSPNGYISPGPHSICVRMDPGNVTWELNEANNTQCVVIYLADTTAPQFEDMFGAKRPRVTLSAYNADAVTAVFPKQNFTVYLNATDDAQDTLNVTFVARLSTNASVERRYYPCVSDSRNDCVYSTNFDPTMYAVDVRNFVFNNTTATSESWLWRVNATDRSANSIESDETTLRLNHWPIQSKPARDVVYGILNQTGSVTQGDTFYPDGASFEWRAPPDLVYRIRLNKDDTGYAGTPNDQYNVTSNLRIKVYMPGGDAGSPRDLGAESFDSDADCEAVEGGIDLPGGRDPPVSCSNMGNFTGIDLDGLRSRDGVGGPGKWNVSIEITDWGGEVRKINQSFTLYDLTPTLADVSLSASDLQPGTPLLVKANVTDDFDVNKTYANFTHVLTGKNFSVELTASNRSQTSDGGWLYTYAHNITTGHGKTVGIAGDYRVSVAAVDAFGNWANTTPFAFKLNDTQAPDLLDAGVTPALQEVGLNVTFFAQVSDTTNVTTTLQVFRGSELLFPTVNMTEEPPGSGNFTFTYNFSTEGSYVWNIRAIDSGGLQSNLKSGPISIRDNLGPKFEVRQPSTRIDGTYYARSAPQIGILVFDSDGVSKDSITLEVGGQNVSAADLVIVPAGLDTKGYVVNYTVPASKKYAHRDVVQVNISAIDESQKLLEGNTTFTFVVDDVPPTTQLMPFQPRFRLADTNVWNVSLDTRFTLVAEDNDGVPTKVDAIRYRIVGGGNNAAEAVYTGPFSIKDAPSGIYTGPRIYQIQYWAVDDVGNQNRTFDSITVFVDDIPPSLDPFGSLPQGRFINASFVDDRSGVDRAVVYYSTNGQQYFPLALDYVAGVWSAVLPEGVKGDKVRYYLQAWDRVNNDETFGNSTLPYAEYEVGDHVPTIKITSPATGSTIQRTVDLMWTAGDEDGDPIVFTVYYRAPGRTTFVELAKIENSDVRKYTLDTERFPDGQYTFRVTATAGRFVSLSETTVSILNRGSAIGPTSVSKEEAEPGEQIVVTAQITKAQAVVKARIFRDGEFVQEYDMNDEGRDGDAVANDNVYSARVAFDATGQYSVEIYTRYQQGGELVESSLPGATTFGVVLTPGRVVADNLGLLVLVGLLAFAGIGVAGYVILRRR